MHNSAHLSQIEKDSPLLQPGRVFAPGLGRQTLTGRIRRAALAVRRTLTRSDLIERKGGS